MKKHLVLAFYLLVMFAIYHHPITLPNEGKAIPTWELPPSAPDNPEIYALERMAQKTGFLKKDQQPILQNPITQNGKKKTY